MNHLRLTGIFHHSPLLVLHDDDSKNIRPRMLALAGQLGFDPALGSEYVADGAEFHVAPGVRPYLTLPTRDKIEMDATDNGDWEGVAHDEAGPLRLELLLVQWTSAEITEHLLDPLCDHHVPGRVRVAAS